MFLQIILVSANLTFAAPDIGDFYRHIECTIREEIRELEEAILEYFQDVNGKQCKDTFTNYESVKKSTFQPKGLDGKEASASIF